MKPIIGVLSLQGDYEKHHQAIQRSGGVPLKVRRPEELDQCLGLIIPGGESTTIGKLMARYGLLQPIIQRAERGFPLFGTCAGLVLLSKKITGYPQQIRLGLLDIETERNAYGRQVESFEAILAFSPKGSERTLHQEIPGIFIRAPRIREIRDPSLEILAKFDGEPVMIRKNNILGASFHPELTQDIRIHRFFIDLCRERAKS